MRVSRTPLAFVALFLLAACGTTPSEVVAPGTNSANSAAAGDGGAGLIGSGNTVATDTAVTPNSTTERGGLGLMGSGN